MNSRKNCNTCRFGSLSNCETLENNEEFQKLLGEKSSLLKRCKYKEEFVCDKYDSKYIQYPLTISSIDYNTGDCKYKDPNVGKYIKIRPCDDDKTYLGLYVGDLPMDILVSFSRDTKKLELGYMRNPAIFVFELNKIVYGIESWWSVIKSPQELKNISDLDIDNIWYIQALKSISEEE